MAKPYSEDLRRRVVETINGGATIPDTAEQCGNGPKSRLGTQVNGLIGVILC